MRLEDNTTVASVHTTDRYFCRAGTLSDITIRPLSPAHVGASASGLS
jgi:hypothetical protein